MLLGEENHSSPVVYRGGMVFLPYRCLSDTLTPVFPFDSFIIGLIGEWECLIIINPFLQHLSNTNKELKGWGLTFSLMTIETPKFDEPKNEIFLKRKKVISFWKIFALLDNFYQLYLESRQCIKKGQRKQSILFNVLFF